MKGMEPWNRVQVPRATGLTVDFPLAGRPGVIVTQGEVDSV